MHWEQCQNTKRADGAKKEWQLAAVTHSDKKILFIAHGGAEHTSGTLNETTQTELEVFAKKPAGNVDRNRIPAVARQENSRVGNNSLAFCKCINLRKGITGNPGETLQENRLHPPTLVKGVPNSKFMPATMNSRTQRHCCGTLVHSPVESMCPHTSVYASTSRL